MTNPPTPDDELEVIRQLLASAATYAESANRGLDSLTLEVRSLGSRVDHLSGVVERFIRQSDVDRQQAAVDRAQAEIDRQEFRAYMRGLQTENNRILALLEQLLQQQGRSGNGGS